MTAADTPDIAGLHFKDPALLRQAFVHGSYLNERPVDSLPSNERLEFLGDALLDVVVARELYRRFPDSPEGELTELKAAVVRRETLARVARRLDLGSHLLMGRGEVASGGRDRDSILADALEALVGAIFLDAGYRRARSFTLQVLAPEMAPSGYKALRRDPKSELQETLQKRGLPLPRYEVVEAQGPDHARLFTVEVWVDGKPVGRGEGRRKAEAEKAAALAALGHLPAGSRG